MDHYQQKIAKESYETMKLNDSALPPEFFDFYTNFFVT